MTLNSITDILLLCVKLENEYLKENAIVVCNDVFPILKCSLVILPNSKDQIVCHVVYCRTLEQPEQTPAPLLE